MMGWPALAFLMGIALLTVAASLDTRFHPPGQGYDDEAKERRRARICAILGIACLLLGALMSIRQYRIGIFTEDSVRQHPTESAS